MEGELIARDKSGRELKAGQYVYVIGKVESVCGNALAVVQCEGAHRWKFIVDADLCKIISVYEPIEITERDITELRNCEPLK